MKDNEDVNDVLDDLEFLMTHYVFGWYELDLLRDFLAKKRQEYSDKEGDCV